MYQEKLKIHIDCRSSNGLYTLVIVLNVVTVTTNLSHTNNYKEGLQLVSYARSIVNLKSIIIYIITQVILAF